MARLTVWDTCFFECAFRLLRRDADVRSSNEEVANACPRSMAPAMRAVQAFLKSMMASTADSEGQSMEFQEKAQQEGTAQRDW